MKRHKLVEYFDSAGKIDIHNHLRQGSLALEEAWGTKKWHHHVCSTILGMVEVDTFIEPFMRMVTASVTDNLQKSWHLLLFTTTLVFQFHQKHNQ